LLPAIIYRRCHEIDENTGQGLITGVNNTGDKHNIANISAIFRKNLKAFSGTRRKRNHDENLMSKISCQIHFKCGGIICR
jgi:hypothetical protein